MSPDLSVAQWRRLRQASKGGDLGIASVELQVTTSVGPARLAVGPAGEALLLLPVDAHAAVPDGVDRNGLTARAVVLNLRGRPQRFLELGCEEERLEAVFGEVVGEILRRLDGGTDPAEAVAGTINEFLDLLRRSSQADVTLERAIGLLGELRVLSRLVARRPSASLLWSGPQGARHDFRAGPAALECKSTRRSQGRRVVIAALDQLQEPPGGELFLWLQVFEPDAAGHLCISEEIERLKLSVSSQGDLESRLEAAGYADDVPAWQDMRFSLLAEEAYRVTDGFPRLTAPHLVGGSLPVGVGRVTYEIDLDAAANFRLDDSELDLPIRVLADAAGSVL
ncbi:PD-(D/E)XK motif protein [Caulobacter sp. 17J65-9]|uniref:PD-(D/E)XK motif protein n=1 Tax=Caulobacter sp. 17J65-9 TaxID=2709382 RepID=UPI0013CB2513|nr:PD-(D/E)XK motif protein [Caulobacter sp. 17J65-9]NEX92970.1 PD-(D/E)XK motif protein [Caulobacter sp. 17J65-9]